MTFLNKYERFTWLFLLVPIYLFLFLKLGTAHIRLWDEGWFSVHAVEMWKNNSWFVSYFDGQPSITSSKPPLQTWIQKLFISVFGISELALRLPSAIAAAITSFLVFFTVKKQGGDLWALTAAMILLTSIGFVGFHTARGAEADSLLTLTLMLQAVSVFRFFETENKNWLIALFLLIGISFWVKSMAGLLLLPGFAIYTLLMKRNAILNIITSWQFYTGIIILLIFIGSYLMLRESNQNGYLDYFFRSNVGRYSNSVGHDHSIGYYITHMMNGRFFWWMPLAVFGTVASFFQKDEWQSLALFAGILSVSYLLVISFAKSKLVWYDMPVYPFAAISAAFGLKTAITNITSLQMRRALMVSIFIFPCGKMFFHTQANTLTDAERDFESQEIYLNKAFQKGVEMNGTVVLHDHFYGSMLFYKHKFESVGQQIELSNAPDILKVNDKVLVKNSEHLQWIDKTYNVDTIGKLRTAVHLNLTSLKKDN